MTATGDPSRRGAFVTVEGTDGVGKSTQIALVLDCLRQAGVEAVATREPGGTPLGEAIRELLLSPRPLGAGARAQLLLVFAARAQHIEEVIAPALARGAWVVCDRFTDASYAYQGAAGGLGFAAVSEIEQWVQGDLRPDLTLLLDAPVETGLARVAGRGGHGDRFETLQLDAKRVIRDAYLERARQFPQRIRVIDAAVDIERVSERIREELARFLAAWRA